MLETLEALGRHRTKLYEQLQAVNSSVIVLLSRTIKQDLQEISSALFPCKPRYSFGAWNLAPAGERQPLLY